MAIHVTDVIPRQVLNFWLEGRYLSATTRSKDYEALGWQLVLRGLYHYQIWEDRASDSGKAVEHPTHWGYCLIDLEESGLYIGGVRIWTSEDWEDEIAKATHPLYWRSDFSYLQMAFDRPALTFVYRLMKEVSDKQLVDITNEQNEQLLGGAPKAEPTGNRLEGEAESRVLEYLCEGFDQDWASFSAHNKYAMGMVHAPLEVSEDNRFSIAGRYAAIGQERVTGKIRLERIPR